MDKMWWKALGMRVLRTTASTLLGAMGTVHIIDEVKWNAAIYTALLSMVVSFFMCVISMPETKAETALKKRENINKQENQ